MNFTIAPNDEKQLRQFLASSELPELAFSYPELCGYLFGISVIPEVIDQKEWLAEICEDNMPYCGNDRDFQHAMAALLRVVEKYRNAVDKNSFSLPLSCVPRSDEEFLEIVDWVEGLDKALSLRPEIWDEHEWMDEMELENLTHALIVFDGIIFPEDAVGMFDDCSENELKEMGLAIATNEEEKIIQVQLFMMNALEVAVICLLEHVARYREMEMNRSLYKKVEKKFAPISEEKQKKGNIIKVDFAGKKRISG